MKKIVLAMLFLFASLGLAISITELTKTEEDYRKAASVVFERELARSGVRSDAFVPVHEWKSNGSTIYVWAPTTNAIGRAGVRSSFTEDDFWGNPIIPDCFKARDDTIQYFGQVCK